MIRIVSPYLLACVVLALTTTASAQDAPVCMDDIESALTLSDDARAHLDDHDFAILSSNPVSNFTHAYELIYQRDLPVYVTADAILYAMHQSFDDSLRYLEETSMIPELQRVLFDMRSRLETEGVQLLGAQAAADADVYLTVAIRLFTGFDGHEPVAGGDPALIGQIVSSANAASGLEDVAMWGSSRQVDFSQFTPRGHYNDSTALQQYFRTMMWLGRVDVRLIDVTNTGQRVFQRRQFDLAAGLVTLMDQATHDRHHDISDVIRAYVGPPDTMSVTDFAELCQDLGVTETTDLRDLDDTTIFAAVDAGLYGTPQIASRVRYNDTGETIPMPSSWMLFGQAYIVDSHAMGELVYDRAITQPLRMMVDPLDVAYTVLDNPIARELLADEMGAYQGYEPVIDTVHANVGELDEEFWGSSLYTRWLGALRSLSADVRNTDGTLPSVFTSEEWGRRILNTQLASWAELRHDTLLYATQSYTGSIACEFPDGYVDPYPQFWQGIVDYAEMGSELSRRFGDNYTSRVFTRLGEVSAELRDMATRERSGQRLTEEQIAFLNDIVRLDDGMGCGPPVVTGWYADLFLGDPLDVEPTIADVHTQPTTADGHVVGHVLHVATGYPRLMVVHVDDGSGPRAFVGAVSSYYELTTSDFQRLDDEVWHHTHMVNTAPVDWMAPLITE